MIIMFTDYKFMKKRGININGYVLETNGYQW